MNKLREIWESFVWLFDSVSLYRKILISLVLISVLLSTTSAVLLFFPGLPGTIGLGLLIGSLALIVAAPAIAYGLSKFIIFCFRSRSDYSPTTNTYSDIQSNLEIEPSTRIPTIPQQGDCCSSEIEEFPNLASDDNHGNGFFPENHEEEKSSYRF